MKTLFLLTFLSMTSAWALIPRQNAMGDACYYIRQKSIFGFCNPANVARDDEQFFYGNFLFSEGMHQTENWKNVVEGKATPAQVVSLLEDDRVSYLTSETNIGVVGKSWAIAFKPYELWVETKMQNPSNPYAQVDAGFAQVLSLDFGHYLNKELSVGLKMEAVQMKLLDLSFFVTDLLVAGNSDMLEPKKKTNFVFTPGMAFEPENAWGNARFSALAKQSYIDNSISAFSGMSFQNDFDLGFLEWGGGLKFERSVVRPQIFSYFSMGITVFTTAIDSELQTYGGFLKFRYFDMGLSYYVTKEDRSLLLQMGFMF